MLRQRAVPGASRPVPSLHSVLERDDSARDVRLDLCADHGCSPHHVQASSTDHRGSQSLATILKRTRLMISTSARSDAVRFRPRLGVSSHRAADRDHDHDDHRRCRSSVRSSSDSARRADTQTRLQQSGKASSLASLLRSRRPERGTVPRRASGATGSVWEHGDARSTCSSRRRPDGPARSPTTASRRSAGEVRRRSSTGGRATPASLRPDPRDTSVHGDSLLITRSAVRTVNWPVASIPSIP